MLKLLVLGACCSLDGRRAHRRGEVILPVVCRRHRLLVTVGGYSAKTMCTGIVVKDQVVTQNLVVWSQKLR